MYCIKCKPINEIYFINILPKRTQYHIYAISPNKKPLLDLFILSRLRNDITLLNLQYHLTLNLQFDLKMLNNTQDNQVFLRIEKIQYSYDVTTPERFEAFIK